MSRKVLRGGVFGLSLLVIAGVAGVLATQLFHRQPTDSWDSVPKEWHYLRPIAEAHGTKGLTVDYRGDEFIATATEDQAAEFTAPFRVANEQSDIDRIIKWAYSIPPSSDAHEASEDLRGLMYIFRGFAMRGISPFSDYRVFERVVFPVDWKDVPRDLSYLPDLDRKYGWLLGDNEALEWSRQIGQEELNELTKWHAALLRDDVVILLWTNGLNKARRSEYRKRVTILSTLAEYANKRAFAKGEQSD